LWSALGVSMFIVAFIGPITGSISPMAISPLMSAFLAVSYFISGLIYDLKWFRNLAYGWWAGAIVTFMWDSVHALGFFCLMMVFLQIIPGIMLYRRSKESNGVLSGEALA
jgi:hypothetical protein